MGLLAAVFLAARVAHGAGEAGLDATNFVTGARAAGMGGAVAASSADTTALQANPAGLAVVGDFGASLSHLAWVAGISYSYVGVSGPVPPGFAGLPVRATAGVSVQVLDYGTIESTRGLAAAASASDIGFSAGGALFLAEKAQAGAAFRYFGHALAGSSAGEATFDLGGTYELAPEFLKVALVVQNLGYAGPLEGTRPPLPLALRGGIELRVATAPESSLLGSAFGESAAETLILTVDAAVYRRGEPAGLSAGAELGLYDFFFGRLGYAGGLRRTGGSGGACAGIGILFRGLKLDYAFGSVGDLGRAQYATLSWMPPRREKVEKPESRRDLDAEYLSASSLYSGGRYAEAARQAQSIVAAAPRNWRAWQLLGNCRYASGDTDGAREAYETSLAINPGNSALRSWLGTLP